MCQQGTRLLNVRKIKARTSRRMLVPFTESSGVFIMMIAISHRIELKPNNKQKTYFRKAFGCSRLAWNWGLAEWQRQYKEGGKPNSYDLAKRFNAVKREQFPFVFDVTKYAVSHSFFELKNAYDRFFKGISGYPRFKRKKEGEGSFYFSCPVNVSYANQNSKNFQKISHNIKGKHQYLFVPKLGWVRMTVCLRFNGKINSVTISSEHGRFYASFSCMISEEEYIRTHNHRSSKKRGSVGIDLGVKNALTLSCGICVDNPKPLAKNQKKITRLQRQLSKRIHAKTKQERLDGVAQSHNYRKLRVKLACVYNRTANIRRDFIQKVTTILCSQFSAIGIETLNVQGMMRNHNLAKSIGDVGFYEIRRQIEYKAANNGISVVKADRFFPSSKKCSCCGNVKETLKLSERVFRCDCCGVVLDRDYNAALNLRNLCKSDKKIGRGSPELTPLDLTALLCLFRLNGIATSKVETGIWQESKGCYKSIKPR